MLNEGHSTNKQKITASARLYDDEEEPSTEMYYDDDEESSYEVNKKRRVEDSDHDYIPRKNAHTTAESSLRISKDGIGAVSGTKMMPSMDMDVIGTSSVKNASLEANLFGAYRIFEYDAK
ncbi:uncharacterized protein A4U43_C07F22570 [Asparagus officinalis]|uniref:Uncharacterized protein n=1 Tax=Asparagus officinalis TaxID=4686 RepID=A0A5P1EE24_ASPOF|nr:uncharacterized protein A4U43_C07F22570 [Asparagus officinalis]